MKITLDDRQHATIIAALRLYQTINFGNRDESGIADLATDGGKVVALDNDGVDELVQRLQFGDVRKPMTGIQKQLWDAMVADQIVFDREVEMPALIARIKEVLEEGAEGDRECEYCGDPVAEDAVDGLCGDCLENAVARGMKLYPKSDA